MTEPTAIPGSGSSKDGIATAAFVVSIVSAIISTALCVMVAPLCFLPFAFLTAVAGIVFGYFGLGARQKRKQARIALIISGVSLFLLICYIVLMLLVYSGTVNILGDPEFWEGLMDGF